jgi:hypothetical protein
VANDPNTLAGVFSSLELRDHEGEHSRIVRVRGIDEGKVIYAVVEVCIECNDTEAVVCFNGIGPIMQAGCRGYFWGNPTFMLPEARYMIIVPALLFSQRPGETMRCVDIRWIAVVVAESGKDWPCDIAFEHSVDAGLGVLCESTGKLILSVMSNKVPSVESPAQ